MATRKQKLAQQYSFSVFLLRGMIGQLGWMNRYKWIRVTGLPDRLILTLSLAIDELRDSFNDERESRS